MGTFAVTVVVEADSVFSIPSVMNAREEPWSVVDLRGVEALDYDASNAIFRAKELLS